MSEKTLKIDSATATRIRYGQQTFILHTLMRGERAIVPGDKLRTVCVDDPPPDGGFTAPIAGVAGYVTFVDAQEREQIISFIPSP